MIRSTIARRLLAGVLLFAACGPALADGAGLGATLYDERGHALGTAVNPLVTAPSSSGTPQPTTPAAGSPSDAATTQQSLTGLTAIGSRAAEPTSLGLWFAQNQSTVVMYLVFYAADGATRIGTIAIDPGAGQGRQGGSASAQDFGPFKGPMTLYGASGAQATLTRQ